MNTEKFYIVTGASSGIGYALCSHLAKQNKVVIAIARRQDLLNVLKNEYPALITTITADIATSVGREKVVEQVSRAGQIVGLINNAATNEPVSLLENITAAQWQKQIEINLNAPLFLTQA